LLTECQLCHCERTNRNPAMRSQKGQQQTADEFGHARGNSSFLQVKAFWLISLCKARILWG
jgi:hypothetical protein